MRGAQDAYLVISGTECWHIRLRAPAEHRGHRATAVSRFGQRARVLQNPQLVDAYADPRHVQLLGPPAVCRVDEWR